jgi:hypothetical protein
MAISVMAGGAIYGGRILVLTNAPTTPGVYGQTVAAGHTVIQATGMTNAGGMPVGISDLATRGAPGTPFNTTVFNSTTYTGAVSLPGETVLMYQVGDRALCDVGGTTTPNVVVGSPIGADTNGRGQVATVGSGNYVVGYALEATTATATFVRVFIQPGEI